MARQKKKKEKGIKWFPGYDLYIAATIVVERSSQKAIVIGKQGKKLKTIGKEARLAMNTYFAQRVHLALWVQVKTGWSDSDQALKKLGYNY